MKKKFPAWIVLTVICLVAALVLAGTNLITKDRIAENESSAASQLRSSLFPSAASFSEKDGYFVAYDSSKNIIGYIVTGTANGFGGPVESTLAVEADGTTIVGVSVGGSSFAETAGLGAKAKDAEFTDQFAGKTLPVALKKNGGEIDAITGATITSNAVISGLNQAATTLGLCDMTAAPAADATTAATAPAAAAETKADTTTGATADTTESTAADTTTGATAAATTESTAADTTTGATAAAATESTVTDTATGATAAAATESTAADTATGATTAASETEAAASDESLIPDAASFEEKDGYTIAYDGEGKVLGYIVSGTAQGFHGPVESTLAVSADGTSIIGLSVGGSSFAETPGLGARAQEASFTDQFTGKSLPVALTKDGGEIDAITGATITSTAVISGISEALSVLSAAGLLP